MAMSMFVCVCVCSWACTETQGRESSIQQHLMNIVFVYLAIDITVEKDRAVEIDRDG